VVDKIKKLLKLLLSSKIIFTKPKKSKIVLFDNTSLNDFKYILKKKEYFLLVTRITKIKEIYVFPELFFLIIQNYRGNLASSYFISILKTINPKLVITFSDNSFKFSEISKILEKKMKFVAIQNALRLDYIENNYSFKNKIIKKNLNKKIYLPHIFTHGQYDIDLFKKLKIKIKRATKFGSLRLENALNYLKKKNINYSKKENDICLISDTILIAHFNGDKYKREKKLISNGMIRLAKYTIDFCRENKKKFIFVPKSKTKGKKRDIELKNYKKNLNFKDYLFLVNGIRKKYRNRHNQYLAMFRSKVTIGTTSTLLGENLSQGHKILSCNFTGIKVFDFAINKICSLNNCSYTQFKKRLNYIFNLKEKKYFSLLSKRDKKYLVYSEPKFSRVETLREKLKRLTL
tara:strand:- start:6938 stop:8146 length:1209 start_codon:yes stop_codon:yes gene_type:complete